MFKHQDLRIVDLKLNKLSNFHPLEVLGLGSGTQLQVGENINKLLWQDKFNDIFFFCSKRFYYSSDFEL